ncbi:Lipase member H [Orchesella cincta]|uniref:Lipase member H n=1 Tax=Orchesella cincta TaxID=48709 RepID=A0A1D2M8P6_ORCCI|nr:Lipase member H [Orchesella cincta]
MQMIGFAVQLSFVFLAVSKAEAGTERRAAIIISSITDDDFDNDIELRKREVPEPEAQIQTTTLLFNLSKNADDVRFLLYNKRNLGVSQELRYNDTESFKKSSFNPQEKTVFLIHGFWTNSSSPMPTTLKKAFLEASVPFNLIVVDWGLLSKPEPPKVLYAPVAYSMVVKRSIPIVYNRIADFIRFMRASNYTSLKKLKIIGHSLGAHVAGGVGRTVASFPESKGRKLARVTGLDPAGPLFQKLPVGQKITKDDAEFVDIYHTAAGTLGISAFTDGHVNFIPNGGHHQPGCVDPTNPVLGEAEFGSCSHNFVTKIYAASITRSFLACECDPELAIKNECPVNCNVTVLAGEPCPASTRGQYYFETT